MEYVASGDIDSEGVHMLSTSGMLKHVEANPDGEFIVATENGMLYPLQQAAPQANLVEANRMAFCKYMKMITLPKLRDSLREMKFEVKVPADARRAGPGADRAHGRDRLATVRQAAIPRRLLGWRPPRPERSCSATRATGACSCSARCVGRDARERRGGSERLAVDRLRGDAAGGDRGAVDVAARARTASQIRTPPLGVGADPGSPRRAVA